MSPNLQDMPSEILTHLGKFCSLSDLNSWAKTNKFFFSTFNSVLYQRNLQPNVSPPLTCLYWAIYTNNLETLNRAVSFGADLNTDLLRRGTDHEDGIALRMANPMYYPIPGSSTPLNLAVCLGNEQVVKFLVENGADLNTERASLCDCHSVTATTYPLHEALVHMNNPSIATHLINGGARLSAPGVPGLFDAVGHQMTLFYQLIERIADLFQRDSQNRTLLHHAVRNQCSPDFILKLIELGLPINHQSDTGQTALNYMTPSDVFAPTAILLVDAGADPNLGANNSRANLLHKSLSKPFSYGGSTSGLEERAEYRRKLLLRLCSDNFVAQDQLSGVVPPHASRGSALFLAACNAKDLDCMLQLLQAGASVRDSVFYREPTLPNTPEQEESILAALIRHDFEDLKDFIGLDLPIPKIFSPLGRITMLLEHGARLDREIQPNSPSALERIFQLSLCFPFREWETPDTAGLPLESHHLLIMVAKAQKKNITNHHINFVKRQCALGVIAGHTIIRTAAIPLALSALFTLQERLYPEVVRIVLPPEPTRERRTDESSEYSSDVSDDAWEDIEDEDEETMESQDQLAVAPVST